MPQNSHILYTLWSKASLYSTIYNYFIRRIFQVVYKIEHFYVNVTCITWFLESTYIISMWVSSHGSKRARTSIYLHISIFQRCCMDSKVCLHVTRPIVVKRAVQRKLGRINKDHRLKTLVSTIHMCSFSDSNTVCIQLDLHIDVSSTIRVDIYTSIAYVT